MSKTLADKINNTQNSFAPQPPGATVPCPFAKTVSESPTAPVEVKTDFSLTQQILQTVDTSSKPTEKPQVKKAWIEIILVDMVGKPIPNVRYRITPPSGAPKEGKLNEHGQAGLYQIDPGNCKITFPDLDKDAWE